MSLLMVAALAVPAMAADEGMIFTAEPTYVLQKDLTEPPVTFEAVVRIPAGYSERAGLIISSFAGTGTQDAISLQINSGKVLELYYELAEGKNVRHKFTDVPVTSIATGEWVHIAVVKDDAEGKAHCYINGEFVQTASAATKDYGYFARQDPMNFCIGGDHRSGNAYYWKGEIREIAMFSDVRTADEIKADAAGLKADKNMQVWFQLSKGMTTAKDLSGNGNHMGDYVEPETAPATEAAPATPAAPSAPATFDAAILFAVAAAAAGAGVAVSKKRK